MTETRLMILIPAATQALSGYHSSYHAASVRTVQRRMREAGIRAKPKEIDRVLTALVHLGVTGEVCDGRGVRFWKSIPKGAPKP